MFQKRTSWILVAALAVMGVVAGCGSGGSSGTAASGTASASDGGNAADSAPSKAQFIKEADEICKKADKEQETVLNAFLKTNSNREPSVKEQETLIKTGGLPLIQDEAEKLGKLPAPSGDEDEVAAIVEGIEKAVSEAEEDVSSVLKKSFGPFAGVSKLAREYGFKTCSNPV
jgi:hypothetical protein